MSFHVVTGSMSPVIAPGEAIVVEPVVSLAELRRFDIIVFFSGGRLVCHYFWHQNALPSRPSAVAQGACVTRALGGGEDLPVEPVDVLGRVVSHSISRFRRARLILRAIARW